MDRQAVVAEDAVVRALVESLHLFRSVSSMCIYIHMYLKHTWGGGGEREGRMRHKRAVSTFAYGKVTSAIERSDFLVMR